MNQIPDRSDILLGYNKFLELRSKQAIANKKYRATENGKLKTKSMHQAWILTKKDDTDYRQNTNKKQRERYHIRRLKKIAESTESTENDTLGEIDSL
jgi:ribosomal protein L35